jgi:hypothetical protein
MPLALRTILAGIALLLLTWPAAGEENMVAFDEATLKDAGVGSDVPALLDFFRKRTLSEADQAKLSKTVRKLGHLSFSVRERATADLIGLGRIARKHLQTALEDRDPEVVRRAEQCLRAIDSSTGTALPLSVARLLAVRHPDGAAAVVLDYLPFADEEALEEELLVTLAAVGVRDGKADPALLPALTDKRPACRAAAALVLGRLRDPAQRAAVRPLLADPEPRVRLRAAQGLIDGKDKEAVPTLAALLTEAPPTVAHAAEELLFRLAGEQAPHASLGTDKNEERRQCRQAWDAWWRNQGPKLDLTKLDLERRLLGMTLIVVLDNGTRGRVWEIGPDRKTRWEIGDVNGPLDAQVIPGNRVLIAEYYGARVTERDFQGKVLWEHKLPVNRRPIAVQRLPNGNTLIASNSDIQEVTRDGKSIFTHTAPNASISGVQKLRNGNVVYVTYQGTLVELDRAGNQVRTFRFNGMPQGLFSVETLPGGRYLVPVTGAGKVVELDATGKTLTEVKVSRPNTATRLPDGNLLVSSMTDSKVFEVDRSGKVVWEQRLTGRPFRVRRR